MSISNHIKTKKEVKITLELDMYACEVLEAILRTHVENYKMRKTGDFDTINGVETIVQHNLAQHIICKLD